MGRATESAEGNSALLERCKEAQMAIDRGFACLVDPCCCRAPCHGAGAQSSCIGSSRHLPLFCNRQANSLKRLLARHHITVTLAAEHSRLPGAQPSWKGLCGLLVPFCGPQSGSSAALGLTGKQHAALQRHRFCVAPPPPEAVANLAAAAQAFLGMVRPCQEAVLVEALTVLLG